MVGRQKTDLVEANNPLSHVRVVQSGCAPFWTVPAALRVW